MTLEIRPFLTLSTAHIQAETASMLDITPEKDWPVAGGRYGIHGYFIYAHDEDTEGNIPPDLWAICEFARKKGCNYFLLDSDGDPVDELPSWEW